MAEKKNRKIRILDKDGHIYGFKDVQAVLDFYEDLVKNPLLTGVVIDRGAGVVKAKFCEGVLVLGRILD